MKRFIILVVMLGFSGAMIFTGASRMFGHARDNARRSSCGSNLKQLGLGMLQYTADYDSHGPLNSTASGGWETIMTAYVKSCPIVNCPSENSIQFSGPGGGGVGAKCPTDYWMNASLFDRYGRGISFERLSSNKLLYGDGDGRKGTSYYTMDARRFDPVADDATRHLGGANYAFVDGHVKWAMPGEIGTRWKW